MLPLILLHDTFHKYIINHFKLILYIVLLCFGIIFCPSQAISQPKVEKGPQPEWVAIYKINQNEEQPKRINPGQYYLHVDKQIKVSNQYPTKYFSHYSIHITNDNSVEESSQIAIVYDPSYEKLILHQLIIRREGRIIDKLPNLDIQEFRREKNMEHQIYDGRLTANIIVEDVRIGDIIEYAYTITGDNPIYNGIFSYWIGLSGDLPADQLNITLFYPKNKALYQQKFKTSLTLKEAQKDNYIVYSLEEKNIKSTLKNTETPEWYNAYSGIYLSELEDWSEVIAWGLSVYDIEYQNNPAIVKIAKEIKDKYASPEDQALAALKFVQHEIRYLGVEFGIHSHKPSLPGDTIKKRYGDCKDKSVVLISILRALGFDSYPAFVNTRLKDKIIDYQPSIKLFNHVVVYSNINGSTYWLDPTLKYQGSRLSCLIQPAYGYALVISPGNKRLSLMPTNDNLVGIEYDETIDLREGVNNPVSYTIITRSIGYDAEYLRRQLSIDGRQKIHDDYLNFYTKYYPSIHTLQPIEVVEIGVKNTLETVEKYSIDNFWIDDKANNGWTAKILSNAVYSYLRKPEQIRREAPYHLIFPVNIKQTIRVLLPEPWDVTQIDFKKQTAFLQLAAKVTYIKDNNSILLYYHYQTLKDHIMPDEMDEYLASIEEFEKNIDFELFKPYHQVTSSEPWLLRNITAILIVLFIVAIIYILIELLIDTRKSKTERAGIYYPVSIYKFALLSIATVGLYQIFWFYNNWNYIKKRDDSSIMPFWRSVFGGIWFYSYYHDLTKDSKKRFGKNILPNTYFIVLLWVLYIISSLVDRFEGIYAIIPLLGFICLLPFLNYINYVNREDNDIIVFNSKLRPRHYILTILSSIIIFIGFASELNWIPNGEVIKGNQLRLADKKFIQQCGLLNGDEKLIYFYSNGFLSFRGDGNGITDRKVFSYWKDDSTDRFFTISALYSDIRNINVNSKSNIDLVTEITVHLKDGSEFILYAAQENEMDNLFVRELRRRLVSGNY